jgi:predicted nucleotide-binding protein
MANNPSPSVPEAPRLSRSQMQAAIGRFRGLIADLETFDPDSIRDRSDSRIVSLEAAIDQELSDTFGKWTPDYTRYAAAGNLDTAGINYAFQIPLSEVIRGLVKGKERAIALLNQVIRTLENRLTDFDEIKGEVDQVVAAPAPASREIFIVHGHDSPAKAEVARLIEHAGLTPVILHEQPNAGRTIIEKFEDHGGAAGFAVVVLTPDDVGGSDAEHLQPRARQNVIGVMFWFAGRLRRNRVCALKKGDIEMPSDFAGVGYTDMDDRGAWKAELLRELKAAGYEVDWGKALA